MKYKSRQQSMVENRSPSPDAQSRPLAAVFVHANVKR